MFIDCFLSPDGCMQPALGTIKRCAMPTIMRPAIATDASNTLP
ncbi:hypothetical protein [Burkholderia ambifaria]|nr:hypothetical protein [Burkholderia ambifaria]